MADEDLRRAPRTPEEIERELDETRVRISRTIEAIQSRVAPSQLTNEALGYLRDSGGEFAKNLGTAAKSNPVPVALVGLGLAWLMMGRGTPGYLQGSREMHDEAGGFDSGTSFGGPLDADASYANSASDQAAAAGHRLSSAASGASERVRRMREDVRSLTSEWSEGASGVAEAAADRIHRARESVQERAMHMRNNTTQMLRDQPLVAGALGLAIGAVLGALLPLSRRENELMGETRDQLFEQARDYGEHAVQQAADVAKTAADAAAEAAKSEAEKQGLTDSPSTERSARTTDQNPTGTTTP
jgi:ElaB/YqjD/DUF883 family membrane-anchored ribosome-binding protein